MPFGLLASGVRGEATNNMKSTGTVATSRSNRAALKRRVLTGCKSNSSNSNSSCSSESNITENTSSTPTYSYISYIELSSDDLMDEDGSSNLVTGIDYDIYLVFIDEDGNETTENLTNLNINPSSDNFTDISPYFSVNNDIFDSFTKVRLINTGFGVNEDYGARFDLIENGSKAGTYKVLSGIVEDLNVSSIVNVVNSNGNKYVLNGSTTYNEFLHYALYKGVTYTLKNIDQNHPMAIIDVGSGGITYSGDNNKKTTKNVNGTTYDFYYGDITINVSNNFEKASIYCFYHGYMGERKYILKYYGLPPDSPQFGTV